MKEVYFFRLVVFLVDFLVDFLDFLAMCVTSFHCDKSKYENFARQRFFAFTTFFFPAPITARRSLRARSFRSSCDSRACALS